MFGSIADVLHYNVSSRLPTDISNRLFGIPIVCFSGDFLALMPRILATNGLADSARCSEQLGIRPESAKSGVGPSIPFLGLLGTFPAHENGSELLVILPEEQSKDWPALIPLPGTGYASLPRLGESGRPAVLLAIPPLRGIRETAGTPRLHEALPSDIIGFPDGHGGGNFPMVV